MMLTNMAIEWKDQNALFSNPESKADERTSFPWSSKVEESSRY